MGHMVTDFQAEKDGESMGLIRSLKMTGRQLLQNMRSLRFVLAVLLCACVCMLPNIDYFDESGQVTRTVLDCFVRGGFEEPAADSAAFSSMGILQNFDTYAFFSMLLAAICAFPAVSRFADEYYSGTFYLTLPGSSVKRYSAAKFLAAGLTGGTVFLAGFGLYALLIWLRFPRMDSYSPETVQLYQSMYGSIDAGDMAVKVLHITVVAILYASAVMMLSVFLRDRYFLFGLSMLAIFFIDRLSIFVFTLQIDIYGAGYDAREWWKIFSPRAYAAFYRDFERNVGLPYPCFFLLALLELVMMYLLFCRRIRRKVKGHA